MFVDFYKALYDSGAEVLDLNSLVSKDVLDTIVGDAVKLHHDRAISEQAAILIKYKTKKKVAFEALPTEIVQKSTYIVQFDIFSTEPELLKDLDGKFAPVLERWKVNIERKNRS
jgi:hypothetical protein